MVGGAYTLDLGSWTLRAQDARLQNKGREAIREDVLFGWGILGC